MQDDVTMNYRIIRNLKIQTRPTGDVRNEATIRSVVENLPRLHVSLLMRIFGES